MILSYKTRKTNLINKTTYKTGFRISIMLRQSFSGEYQLLG